MSEVFEGDNFDNRQFIAQDLDLFEISNKYKHLWLFPEYSSLHTSIVLLIRKGLSYSSSSKILNKINEAIGNKQISKTNFTMTDKKLKQWGLSSEKIEGIRKILNLEQVTSNSLCKIKEGGLYLVKLFKIINQEDDDIFLWDDYNVLRNMGILFYRNKSLSKQECIFISKNWIGYRSQISYFLYRLRPEGALKICEDLELNIDDFWN